MQSVRVRRPRPKVPLICQDCRADYHGLPGGRFCPVCRWRHRGRQTKMYVWTPEKDQLLRDRYDSKVRNRAREIARQLGWPAWVIKKRASSLGLSHPWPADRRDWTPDEERYLEEHAGRRHVNWLSKHLKRSLTSTVLKLKRMGLRRRVSEGYTLCDLQACFGTDHHVIERWVREGKLQVSRRNPDAPEAPRHAWQVSDRAVLRFVREHPLAFRLDKVDQVWFMDLVMGGGLLRAVPEREAVNA